MRRVADALVAVTFDTVRKAGPEAQADSGERRVIFETGAGVIVEARLVTIDNTPWVIFHADVTGASVDPGPARAIEARTEGWAFRLSNDKMLALMLAVKDLITPEVRPEGPNAPGQIITDPALLGLPGKG